MGKMFLVVVDAHSKWLEVEMVPSTLSMHTIAKLRATFAMYGLPELLVSHIASIYLHQCRIQGILQDSAPYHPYSSGLAERYAHTFKTALKKGSTEDI